MLVRTSTSARAANAADGHVHARKKASDGLTLLELLVVIAILALLLTVAVPSMQALIARNRLKGAAQAIAEDLQWSRSEAIKRNRTLLFRLNPGSWCYGVEEAGTTACDCRLATGAAGACAIKRVSGVDFPGIALDASFAATSFEPRRATAINGTITVTSPHGSVIAIVLSRLGRVRLCTPTRDIPGYEPCDD